VRTTAARAGLGAFLIDATVLLDLLPDIPHVMPQRIDDRIELLVEILGCFDDARRIAHRRSV